MHQTLKIIELSLLKVQQKYLTIRAALQKCVPSMAITV